MMKMMMMKMMKMMYEDDEDVMNTLQAAPLNVTPKRMREREEDSLNTPAKARRCITDLSDSTPKELELEEAGEDAAGKEGDFVYTDYVFPGAVKKAHQGQECCVIIFELEKQSKGCYRATISDGEDFSRNLFLVGNLEKAEAELVGKISVVNLFDLTINQKVDYIC